MYSIEKMNYQLLKFGEQNGTTLSSDLLIDYCNYALQAHFRLTNSFKLLQQQIYFRKNNCEKILNCFYNILTDSLALDATTNTMEEKRRRDENGDETKCELKMSSAYSNESFILAFKQLKKYLHEQDMKLNISSSICLNSSEDN